MHFSSYYRWLVIREWVRVNSTDYVLDVGCDDGEILAAMNASMKVGVDLDPRHRERSLQIVCADARCLPIPLGRFDSVFAFDIIEHIVDDRAVLTELLRVLSDCGNLWISTPSSHFSIFPRVLTERANRGWGHVRNGYTAAEINEKLPNTKVVDVMLWNEPCFRFAYVVLRLINNWSPSLACGLAHSCFQIDSHLSAGANGHLFIHVCKASGSKNTV